ncbi:MAG: HIT domain-containing protein [Acidimicrobiia bacterium]|nr:HIT domain-containing protein [Acidimicrobiia bacterium]
MDTLWAGWRSGYVRSADEQNEAGCLFCRLPGEDDAAALILERGPLAFSVLNRFPYTTGHLMVSQYRHVADLADLTAPEVADLWRLLARARRACGEAMHPDGFNLGSNLGRVAGAGVPDHLHLHLVGRHQFRHHGGGDPGDPRGPGCDLAAVAGGIGPVWVTRPEGWR